MSSKYIKPFVKWLGGKTQIIDKIIPKIPTNINNYYEIFVGGGSVLLAVLQEIQSGNINIQDKIFAYDINEALIYTYKNIQNNYLEVYDIIKTLIEEYKSCNNTTINRNPKCIEDALTSQESYYYWIRSRYNKLLSKKTTEASAFFIFLNKTCFRGMYRESINGMNVPYGNYKNPEIINLDHLETIHKLIKNVNFICCDFRVALNNKYCIDDFIYFDPPYYPENIKSFVSYTKNGFSIDDHNELFTIINNIEIKFLLSNSDNDIIYETFKKYNIETVLCKRKINSKNPKSTINEVLIVNY